MEAQELVDRIRDTYSARRVFGDAVTNDGVTVIPAARVRGGGGGGTGEQAGEQKGSGGGFGVVASPAGAFEIRQGQVRWRPAIDVNRIIMGGQLVAATALLSVGRILAARMTHRRHLLRWPLR